MGTIYEMVPAESLNQGKNMLVWEWKLKEERLKRDECEQDNRLLKLEIEHLQAANDLLMARNFDLQREAFRLKLLIASMKDKGDFDKDDYVQKLLKVIERQNEKINNQGTTQFSGDDLKRLVQLCHPDRHGNSELAQKMTQILNKLRKP